jgi:ABC-type polysaccharide/polyol phosphate transport system ATPase subunit
MISVRNLAKVFKIPHARKTTLFHKVVSIATRNYDYEEFYAVKDVSFEVRKGEFVGIVGRNGSGKSTLLKLLSRIYQPSSGEVIIRDNVFPLLELGVGFQPDFSVRENIYLYGSLLGFKRAEMNRKLKEILTFAELERFLDARLERLSTGMQVRLAFAIAIQSVTPILLVDEVLAVGDAVFQEKCRKVFWDFKSNGKTILFVSHDAASVKEYCDRVMVMDQGVLCFDGKPDDGLAFYNECIHRA